jgi:RimJ/RimL family protein N-acetyltransferase
VLLRPTYPIRTERLSLRPLTVADTDALLDYRSRPDVALYVPFEPMTREVVEARITQQWVKTDLTDEGQALTLGVEVSATGQLVGDVVLFWHSREHRGGEIGYVLHPGHSGNGYATEAAKALLRLGFEDLGLHRIVARIDERNDASARLARRLGMRLEARLVENEYFKGEWTNELDFAMLAEEWRGMRDSSAPRWVVWRQDDNGNRYEVGRRGSRAEAEELAATMEARRHKQTYWVTSP